MFIHWGIYSVPAGEWKGRLIPGLGEWIMNRAKIPVSEYEQLANQFNPVKFDAEEWVRLAREAGMRYLVITAKHHDGFAMYHSKASPYNLVDATPFKRDPMKELAEACRKAGIKLCFYYSHAQDWHHPDAAGNDWDFPDEARKTFAHYFEEKVKAQVRELLTNYGSIGLIWYDTPRVITKEQSEELARLTHELQPMCLVSGRVGHGAGDYDSVGDNQISVGNVRRDWESPVTINDTWGFKKDDHNWKSATILVRQMAQIVSRNGNYLLNVGPTAEGVIPQPSVERLAEVGRWMRTNGESIYGTSAGPFPYELPWGVITTKPGRIYLHVFEWPQEELVIYGLKNMVKKAWLLAGKSELELTQSTDPKLSHHEIRVRVPSSPPDAHDSVIVLEIEGEPEAETGLTQQPDGVVRLPAYLAEAHHAHEAPNFSFDSRGVIQQWLNKEEWVAWDFKLLRPGNYDVVVVTSEQKYGRGWEGGHRVIVEVAGQRFSGVVADQGKEVNPTNPYWTYVLSRVGRVQLDRAGVHKLTFRPESIETAQNLGLTLVAVRLVPAQ
jgi:alpha-L-fucosidase